jgi:hypothetical protein
MWSLFKKISSILNKSIRKLLRLETGRATFVCNKIKLNSLDLPNVITNLYVMSVAKNNLRPALKKWRGLNVLFKDVMQGYRQETAQPSNTLAPVTNSSGSKRN